MSVAWKRPFVWLSRFRHRCGYGVHSPFAFDLITHVIYERTPYYAYKQLDAERRKQVKLHGCQWRAESAKVSRLLFRLVNRVQPSAILDVGVPSAASLYLQAGKVGACYWQMAEREALIPEKGVPLDFLYLHDFRHPAFVEQVFVACVSRTTVRSVFVVEGICYNKAMKELWKRMQADPRVGVTFDLYDLGILFFDRSKIKQHYLVNF